jgi:hypothetical protein
MLTVGSFLWIFPSEVSSQLVDEPVDDLDDGDKTRKWTKIIVLITFKF